MSTKLKFFPVRVLLTSSTSANKSKSNSYVLGSTLNAVAVVGGTVVCPEKEMWEEVRVRVYEGSSSGTETVRKTMFFSGSCSL